MEFVGGPHTGLALRRPARAVGLEVSAGGPVEMGVCSHRRRGPMVEWAGALDPQKQTGCRAPFSQWSDFSLHKSGLWGHMSLRLERTAWWEDAHAAASVPVIIDQHNFMD